MTQIHQSSSRWGGDRRATRRGAPAFAGPDSALGLLLVLAFLAGPLRTLAQTAPVVQPVPDFHLKDANPTSPRYNATASPRDYRLQISAYYFGSAG